MANFDHTRMEAIVKDVLNAACAPPRSPLWKEAPDRALALWIDGDSDDACIFTMAMWKVVADGLGLRNLGCEHPHHWPKYVTAFVPFDDNGQPQMHLHYIGPPEEAPLEMKANHPDILIASEMMNAELLHDPIRSRMAWNVALGGGFDKEVVGLAIRQAGDVRRRAMGRVRAN